jgi:hypothetical protein
MIGKHVLGCSHSIGQVDFLSAQATSGSSDVLRAELNIPILELLHNLKKGEVFKSSGISYCISYFSDKIMKYFSEN